jgi:short-subunit dehydrogenase
MTIIKGKTILLTGASRGIGAVMAKTLAKEQATIIGVSRSSEALKQMCAEIESLGGQAIGIPFDISQIAELPTLIEKIEQSCGAVDILINNAAIEIYRAFQDYSTAEINSILTVNLVAAMELSRLLIPGMLKRECGHIINMASTAAKKGHPYDSVYSASKAGLLMWADALRQELMGTGIKISTICPGYVSQVGMLADTGLPAPDSAGTSTPEMVTKAVIEAIRRDLPEVIINQDFITTTITKLLLVVWQLFPHLGDTMYRLSQVPQLNQQRIQNQLIQSGLNQNLISDYH